MPGPAVRKRYTSGLGVTQDQARRHLVWDRDLVDENKNRIIVEKDTRGFGVGRLWGE